MTILIWFLTVLLVISCLFLILLVLVQLPKKEAGAGVAFGGGATDALFGAGSGNALTKLTKYFTTAFLGLALVLTILNSYRSKNTAGAVERALRNRPAKAAATTTPPLVKSTPTVAPTNALVPLTTATTNPITLTPLPAPAANSTSAPSLQITPAPASKTTTTNSAAPSTKAPATQQPKAPAQNPSK